VHPLVGTVLLGVSGQDPLMLNAEADPPDVQLGQAVNPSCRERYAVVCPDRAREPMLTEQPIEDRAYSVALRRQEPMAGQQVARVLVRNRQRVAVDPVAGSKMPFEVRRPEIVRLGGRCTIPGTQIGRRQTMANNQFQRTVRP